MARKWTAKAEKKYGWTYGGLEIYIFDVYRYLMTRYGTMTANFGTINKTAVTKTARYLLQ